MLAGIRRKEKACWRIPATYIVRHKNYVQAMQKTQVWNRRFASLVLPVMRMNTHRSIVYKCSSVNFEFLYFVT